MSIGALYHEIFGNDGRLEFNSFKSDIEWLNSNGLISLNNNAITIDKKVAKTLIDYVFEHKAEIWSTCQQSSFVLNELISIFF